MTKDTSSAAGLPRIIPSPKRIQALPSQRPLKIPNGGKWLLTGKHDERLISAVRVLVSGEADWRPAAGARKPVGAGTVLEYGTLPSTAPKQRGTSAWRSNPEGYRLEVGSAGVRIIAMSPRGAYWALQTLAQLLEASGARRECPAVLVEDWPALPFRGTHWFPSRAGLPFHRSLITRIMARYKLNATVIECQEARWDSHPEIAAAESVTKEGLKELVSLARDRFIEPIPLISCPGHAGWIFRNGKHLDLAEDPSAAYAYCVNHPEARKLVAEVLSEAIELFQPSRVHLGHDEAQLRGRFPNPACPRCGGKNAGDLVTDHARYWHGWLRKRDLRTMLWSDMFLAPEEGSVDGHAGTMAEARRRRKALPKDVLMADWHYGPRKYDSLEVLGDDGFSTLACTWYRPKNIQLFSQSAVAASVPRTPTAPRCRGLLQTTWAGHFPDERVLRGREERQFNAWILAAEYAWTGRSDSPESLGFDSREVFRRAYNLPE